MAEFAASSGAALRDAPRAEGRSSSGSASSSASRRSRALHLAHRLVVAAAVVVLVVAMALVLFRGRYDGKVLPSVVVADVPVGGLSRDAARSAVEARSQQLLARPLTFTHEGRSWNPTFADLGVAADPSSAVDAAFAIGRESDARDRLASSFDVSRQSRGVPLPMSIDPAAAVAWAELITAELGLTPQDARIELDGAEVSLRPDADGFVVDAERLAAIVDESVATMTPYSGSLPVAAVPAAVRSADLEGEAARLSASLAQPITIVYKKERWTLQPADLARFVAQRPKEDGPGVLVDLDREALSEWLQGLLAEAINRPARDAVVAWNGDRLGVVEASRDGLRVRPKSLAEDVAASFFGDHGAVSIPVRVVEPDIDSDRLKDLKINRELGRGTSNFSGSDTGRSTNIVVGTDHMNGSMVAPGGDFSFNEAIGDIVTDRGYVESDVVQGERIGKDIGGGICQVSTTVFRAAYQAGLPMTEWNPHLYRLGFYETDGYAPGLDASILQTGPREDWGDFRFKNPTDGWLLIESYVVDTQVVVIIYGPDTGWDITFSDPWMSDDGLKAEDQEAIEIVDAELAAGTVRQSEWALDGLEVSHQRIVKDQDGNVLEDEVFTTYFAARPNVYKVSPDMAGQSPAGGPGIGPDDGAADDLEGAVFDESVE